MPSRALLLLLLTLSACAPTNKTCDESLAVSALAVVVSDGASGACIEGATVTAADAAGRVVAFGISNGPTPPCGEYWGLGDGDVKTRSAWTVTVEKAGYATAKLPVTMDQDGCHVVSQKVAVKLMTTP